MSYRVLADDNFHNVMDDNFRHSLGEFPTYTEALAVCEEVVERFLRHEYVPGMSESALYFRYMMFGRYSFIAERPELPGASPGFSAWDYAKSAPPARFAAGYPRPLPAKSGSARRGHRLPLRDGRLRARRSPRSSRPIHPSISSLHKAAPRRIRLPPSRRRSWGRRRLRVARMKTLVYRRPGADR